MAEPIGDAAIDAVAKMREAGERIIAQRDARIRALEAENARLEAIVQARDAQLTREISLSSKLAAENLRFRRDVPPWLPTHQHLGGQLVREIRRNDRHVVVDVYDEFLPEWWGIKHFERGYRPLSPDEARALVETERRPSPRDEVVEDEHILIVISDGWRCSCGVWGYGTMPDLCDRAPTS